MSDEAARKSKPKTPKATLLARRLYVTKLILAGLTYAQIVENLTRDDVTTENEVRNAYQGIVAGWRRDQDAADGTARAEAIQRLRRDLADMRSPGQLRNKNGYPVFEKVLDPRTGVPVKANGRFLKRPVQAPIDWARIASHEALLAKIEGTMRPIEHKVDVNLVSRTALLAIVSDLSGARMDELVAEQTEIERRARLTG